MFLIHIISNKTAFWSLSPFHVVIPFFLAPPFFWNCEDTDSIFSTHMMLMKYIFLAKYLSFLCMDNSVPGLGIFPKHQEANQKGLILEAPISLYLRYNLGTKALCYFFSATGKLGQWKGRPSAPISLSVQAEVSQEAASQKEIMHSFSHCRAAYWETWDSKQAMEASF